MRGRSMKTGRPHGPPQLFSDGSNEGDPLWARFRSSLFQVALRILDRHWDPSNSGLPLSHGAQSELEPRNGLFLICLHRVVKADRFHPPLIIPLSDEVRLAGEQPPA